MPQSTKLDDAVQFPLSTSLPPSESSSGSLARCRSVLASAAFSQFLQPPASVQGRLRRRQEHRAVVPPPVALITGTLCCTWLQVHPLDRDSIRAVRRSGTRQRFLTQIIVVSAEDCRPLDINIRWDKNALLTLTLQALLSNSTYAK